MREIKFRGLDKSGKWRTGNLIQTGDKAWIGSTTTLRGWFEVEPNTGGQFTGLHDKNGREIYEGDILEAEHKLKTQKFNRKYRVIFNEKGYWDAISLDDKPVRLCYAGFNKCEVIGNIYENTELLEGEE